MAMIQRHYPLDQVSEEQLRQALQILTTEHSNLQTCGGRELHLRSFGLAEQSLITLRAYL